MKYTVQITDAAYAAIADQARYIAVTCRAPLNAQRWLQKIWDAIDGLEQFPHRHALAAENEFKRYEVRRALVGDYLILFTIDDEGKNVWIIGFRQGSRLPRPDDLPDEQPGQNH